MKKLCPAASESQPHFASASELKAHRGVCKKCHDDFLKRGKATGHREEDSEAHEENQFARGVAFVDGHAEQTVDFDYDAVSAMVDRGNPMVAELEGASSFDKTKIAAEGFKRIADWCLRNNKNKLRTAQSAAVRFEAAVALLFPEMLDHLAYSSIGARHGVGKAAMTKAATEFSDTFKSHFRRSRREESRKKFSKKTKATHEKRKRIDEGKPKQVGLIARLMARNQKA